MVFVNSSIEGICVRRILSLVADDVESAVVVDALLVALCWLPFREEVLAVFLIILVLVLVADDDDESFEEVDRIGVDGGEVGGVDDSDTIVSWLIPRLTEVISFALLLVVLFLFLFLLLALVLLPRRNMMTIIG